MNIDWVVAIVIFLVFISWSFVYYTGFFFTTADMMGGVEGISNKVVDYLDMDVYDVPLVFDSGGSGSRVLYADFTWPLYSRNSTRVFSGNQSLPCYMTGSRVYWQADVIPGRNRFSMRYYDENVSLVCDSSFPLTNATQVVPWVSKKNQAVSQSRINQMLSMDFHAFALALGISQDFGVEVDINNVTSAYGKTPPLGYNVYVKETPVVTENKEQVKVRVLTW